MKEELKEELKEESAEELKEKPKKERSKKDIIFMYIIFLKHTLIFSVPSALAKQFYETKDKKKNNKLVNVVNKWLKRWNLKKCLKMKKKLKNQTKY